MVLPCDKGGANMVQFELFAKALKITWIRRILKYDSNSKLYNLCKVNTPHCNFDYSADEYWKSIIEDCHNMFWKNVFTAWKELMSVHVPTNREEVLSSSIWYNANIKVGKKSVLYKTWERHGIKYVNDLLDSNGVFLSLSSIQNNYKIKINFLQYYGIKRAIMAKFSHLLKSSNNILKNPFQGFNISIILKDVKGCKRFYNVFINCKQNQFKCINKWNQILNINFDNKEWFYICHYNWKCTNEVKLRWFQFRLLNRNLCTYTPCQNW